jgi:hypothetical protein
VPSLLNISIGHRAIAGEIDLPALPGNSDVDRDRPLTILAHPGVDPAGAKPVEERTAMVDPLNRKLESIRSHLRGSRLRLRVPLGMLLRLRHLPRLRVRLP